MDIPADVSDAFAEKGYVAVHGTLNGVGVRGTLMPIAGGRRVMYLNPQVLSRTNVRIGDTVDCVLDRDPGNRKPVPLELTEALAANPVARQAWEAASPAYRKRAIKRLVWFTMPGKRKRATAKILCEVQRPDSESQDHDARPR